MDDDVSHTHCFPLTLFPAHILTHDAHSLLPPSHMYNVPSHDPLTLPHVECLIRRVSPQTTNDDTRQ